MTGRIQQERPGLGFRVETEVAGILERLVDNPLQFPMLERGVRRAQLGIFPYAVFFRFENGMVTVLGVLHLHRHTKVWKLRG
jgi:hypothetical protein